MRVLIWSLTALVIAAWSFVSWLAHLVVQAGGGLLASNADIVPADPLVVEWVSWLATIGMVVWFVVDSALSVATGFWMNAVSNTGLAVGYLVPVLASGAMRGQARVMPA